MKVSRIIQNFKNWQTNLILHGIHSIRIILFIRIIHYIRTPSGNDIPQENQFKLLEASFLQHIQINMDFLDQLINIIFCFFHIPIEERHAAIEASFQPEADTYIICILTIFRRSKFHNLIIERQSLIKFTSQDMSPSQRTENVEIIRILVIRFIEQSHGIINTMSLERQ